MNPVTVAVVQAGSILFDREKTLQKAADLTRDSARRGARLIVFPEAFVGGYPKGFDFGARVGSRTPEGREQFRVYHESAMEVPGPCCDAIGALARDYSVDLVIGVVERDGGTLYCTVLFSTLPVFETPAGRVGAVICWENYMPLLRMAMYGKGIELYCAPTVDDRETWLPTMRHIALEGRCFVLSACQYQAGLIGGGSVIVNPLGQVLAGPHREGETILTADLDLGDLARGKYDLDVTGHYARPDVFRLIVDETPKPAVVWE
ncbi:MAG: nitrilase-related carbon-nitrogen hydrolase [Bryobacteraceae bacterium]